MGSYLSDRELERLARADQMGDALPVLDLAGRAAEQLGTSRRSFLQSACGMAASFLAMNEVYGDVFDVGAAELTDQAGAQARAAALARQFVFDVQTHFVHDEWRDPVVLGLGQYAAEHWTRGVAPDSLAAYRFDHYIEEIFLASDTDVALITAAPFAGEQPWLLDNAQMAATRRIVNEHAGERRMLSHAVFTPGAPGWLESIDQAVEELKPDSWKGYTIGDPFFSKGSKPYRLDDEKLVYPAYERFVRSGIRTVCIHKGLLPADYRDSQPDRWRFATVEDVGRAARDWPQLNFMIYHAGLRPFLEAPDQAMADFDRTGRIDWATDLAEIPAKFGVSNVYAEIGSAFAMCCTTDPQFAAALMGTLLRGMGPERVVWGTDSVWYGSPQWQIEALRRLEIPAPMRKRHGFRALGAADGAVKSRIFGLNAAPLYRIDPAALKSAVGRDAIARMKLDWQKSGAGRSNRAYGYVVRE
jgi:predicted TIM-barrel fold metal-dependent hydrolase